jgi:hypothetical protein
VLLAARSNDLALLRLGLDACLALGSTAHGLAFSIGVGASASLNLLLTFLSLDLGSLRFARSLGLLLGTAVLVGVLLGGGALLCS